MSNKHTILQAIAAAGELCEVALEEIEDIVERCQYARTTPRDRRLTGFYDNELVEEIERRGYPVGRKDITASILTRDEIRQVYYDQPE